MFYRLLRFIFKILFKIFFRPKIIGLENIPKEGAFILAVNHMSNADPPFIGTFAERMVCYMAKEELFKNPIFAAALRNLNVFPVKRGAADKGAIKNAIKILKSGKVLGIFPEGTRSKTGRIGKAESGVSLIAAMTKAPIIPAAIVNTDKIFSADVKFPQLVLVFGKPIEFNGDSKDKDELANFAQNIMVEVSKLKTVGENSLTK
jgi:1-acyl-sn-glycerol-3-phosphate acyltransferase